MDPSKVQHHPLGAAAAQGETAHKMQLCHSQAEGVQPAVSLREVVWEEDKYHHTWGTSWGPKKWNATGHHLMRGTGQGATFVLPHALLKLESKLHKCLLFPSITISFITPSIQPKYSIAGTETHPCSPTCLPTSYRKRFPIPQAG